MTDRAGLLARLLRRPCPVCERHKHHRDPYVRARPACPEWWHRRQYARRKRQESISGGSGALDRGIGCWPPYVPGEGEQP